MALQALISPTIFFSAFLSAKLELKHSRSRGLGLKLRIPKRRAGPVTPVQLAPAIRVMRLF